MIPKVAREHIQMSMTEVLVNARRNAMNFPILTAFDSFKVSLVCMHVRTLVYLFVCFPVLRVCMLPEGKQAVWGVICFCRG